MAGDGTFSVLVVREGHPSPTKSGEPFCTRSQMLAYMNTSGHRMALVHQYLRPDGTIGASGQPDPKKMFYKGVLYSIR
jgi:hypothetical protein